MGILSDFGGVYVAALGACWEPTLGKNVVQQLGENEQLQFSTGERISCNLAALVRHNVLHDAECYNYGGDGFYNDEAAAGVDVIDNLIYDVDASGIYFHCGVNLTANNNFVAFSDRLGIRAALSSCNLGGFPIHVPVEFAFTHNIVYVSGNRSHLTSKSDFVDNSTFDNNVYFGANGPLEFFGGVSFQQWQEKGKVRI